MKTVVPRLILTVLFTGSPYLAADSLNDPYVISNRSPFVEIYGLPAAQSAQLQDRGRWLAGLQLDVSNNFTENDAGDEVVFIDGETYRSNLQLRYGWSDRLELGIDIPWIGHDGGNLDDFIDDWHSFFGLPDGDRPDYEQDQLLYGYSNSAGDRFVLADNKEGVGDISLSAAWQLSSTPTRDWALRAALKLPTGDADYLLGSESTDVALGVSVSDRGWLADQSLTLHGSAGILLMGDGEVLEGIREDWVVYGSTSLSWRYTQYLSFKLQLDGHSAFYNSGTTELGDASAQLILGGAIRLHENWLLDLAVSEDIAVNTAPDVVFHIGLKTLTW